MKKNATSMAISVAALTTFLGLAGLASGCAAPAPEEETASAGASITADPGTVDEVTLIRSWRAGQGHWASVQAAPRGFIPEQRFTIRLTGSNALFSCGIGDHNFVSHDPNCEGQTLLGFLGYADNDATGTRTPLYRCFTGGSHFISVDPACEGQQTEGLLGWVTNPAQLPPPPPPVYFPPTTGVY